MQPFISQIIITFAQIFRNGSLFYKLLSKVNNCYLFILLEVITNHLKIKSNSVGLYFMIAQTKIQMVDLAGQYLGIKGRNRQQYGTDYRNLCLCSHMRSMIFANLLPII